MGRVTVLRRAAPARPSEACMGRLIRFSAPGRAWDLRLGGLFGTEHPRSCRGEEAVKLSDEYGSQRQRTTQLGSPSGLRQFLDIIQMQENSWHVLTC